MIWSEGIKSLQCLNSDLLLSIPMDWVCISYCCFPWKFEIYLSIHFHFKPHKKRCYQLLCIQWQIPSLITKRILTLATKMMHLIAHGDLNPIHCKGYLCRLMHSSQPFLGLIARGWLKSKLPFQMLSITTWSVFWIQVLIQSLLKTKNHHGTHPTTPQSPPKKTQKDNTEKLSGFWFSSYLEHLDLRYY